MKTFRITLEDEAETVIYKAKGIADKYGANFEGDTSKGSFNSNGVEGRYKISRNGEDTKNIITIDITKKPIVIPWQLVNATLSSFFGTSVKDGAGTHQVSRKDDAKAENTKTNNTKADNTEPNSTEPNSTEPNSTEPDNTKPKANSQEADSNTQQNNKQEAKNTQDGIGGLSGVNWRFFQNDTQKDSKKDSKKDNAQAKTGVVDAEFTEATNTPKGKEKDNRRSKAQEVVNSHVLWAAGSGFIPFPLADMAALTALQIGMLEQLAGIYDIKTSQATGKGFIKALTGSTAAKLAASFIKTIPVIGTVTGGIAMSIASGASTYALGQVVIEQFENERDLDDVDMEAAKAKYNKAYEEGKDITEKIKQEEFKQAQEDESFSNTTSESQEASQTASATTIQSEDIFEKIEKLGALKEKGLISDEEFNTQKTKLLSRL